MQGNFNSYNDNMNQLTWTMLLQSAVHGQCTSSCILIKRFLDYNNPLRYYVALGTSAALRLRTRLIVAHNMSNSKLIILINQSHTFQHISAFDGRLRTDLKAFLSNHNVIYEGRACPLVIENFKRVKSDILVIEPLTYFQEFRTIKKWITTVRLVSFCLLKLEILVLL